MSEPVYKLAILKGFQDAWYQLPTEEQERIDAAQQAANDEVGAEIVLICDSRWANEAVPWWGVFKYPSIEAVQQFTAKDLEWFRYAIAETTLGTRVPEVPEP